jgi:hypothetical protein
MSYHDPINASKVKAWHRFEICRTLPSVNFCFMRDTCAPMTLGCGAAPERSQRGAPHAAARRIAL